MSPDWETWWSRFADVASQAHGDLCGDKAITIGHAVADLASAEMRRRNGLVEDAILRCAERGQRVELLEYHRSGYGLLDTHCDLIANGCDVATVVF